MQEKIKISIVEDQPLFRDGIKSLIKEFPQFEIISESTTSQKFINSLKKEVPDVVFLDLKNGAEETFRYLKKKFPKMKILMPNHHNKNAMPHYKMKKGIHAYLTEDMKETRSAMAVSFIGIGNHLNELIIKPILIDLINKKIVLSAPRSHNFTKRELEVIVLLDNGNTSKEIAKKLFIEISTVNTYRKRILKKIGAKNKADVIAFARKHNLL